MPLEIIVKENSIMKKRKNPFLYSQSKSTSQLDKTKTPQNILWGFNFFNISMFYLFPFSKSATNCAKPISVNGCFNNP